MGSRGPLPKPAYRRQRRNGPRVAPDLNSLCLAEVWFFQGTGPCPHGDHAIAIFDLRDPAEVHQIELLAKKLKRERAAQPILGSKPAPGATTPAGIAIP